MESKQFKGQFKSLEETGIATVVFATLQTIDRDNDWIEKGAVKPQAVKICGSHNWKAAPIGVARISEEGTEAIARMKFNLDMPSAKEWFESIRFNHENQVDQEYSFGFTILDSEPATRNGKKVRVIKELDIFEVSPVLMGAGINTRTVAIKEHSELDETAAEETETADNNAEPKGLIFSDHFDRVLDEVQTLSDRSKALAALRAKSGRTLSRANRERLGRLVADLNALLTETDSQPEPEAEVETVIDEGKTINSDGLFAEYLKTQTEVMQALA